MSADRFANVISRKHSWERKNHYHYLFSLFLTGIKALLDRLHILFLYYRYLTPVIDCVIHRSYLRLTNGARARCAWLYRIVVCVVSMNESCCADRRLHRKVVDKQPEWTRGSHVLATGRAKIYEAFAVALSAESRSIRLIHLIIAHHDIRSRTELQIWAWAFFCQLYVVKARCDREQYFFFFWQLSSDRISRERGVV